MSPDTYNTEHREALAAVLAGLTRMGGEKVSALKSLVSGYLDFRKESAAFQEREYSSLCHAHCFSRGSADCCGKNAIAVFFADMVVNSLVAGPRGAKRLLRALQREPGDSCVYLSGGGCLFALKPIACEMFVCHRIREELLDANPALAAGWEELRAEEKRFTWPAEPVLFDTLEALFIEAGFSAPLMYCHTSPGLLKLKKGWKG